MNHPALTAFAALVLSSMPFATAQGEKTLYATENAFGPATDPIPRLSRLAGPIEFENRFRDGSLVLDVPSRAPAETDARDEETRRLEDFARLALAPARPDLVQQVLSIQGAGDIPFPIRDQRGETLRRSLIGKEGALRELTGAKQIVGSAGNQRMLRDLLAVSVPEATDLLSIDSATISESELKMLNAMLLARLDSLHGRDGGARVPRSYGDCSAEEGSGAIGEGNDGDQTGRRCGAHPLGLLKTADWALKPANTCVRNQGARASSVAFALTAALESRVARRERRYANLSEQHLLNAMHMRWFRSPGDFGEGLAPLLTSGRNRLAGYRFHFEDVWSYNPGYARTETLGQSRGYAGTCERYQGRHCSETNHQGRMLCVTVGTNRYCGYDAPMTAATPVGVNGLALVFDAADPDAGLLAARQLLRAGVPVVMTALVPPSFANVGDDGFVPAATGRSRERADGAHAMALTGWVPNHLLPPSAPEADGGGYFIAKNSWGACAGDAGYYYLAGDWVRAHALSLIAVF